MGDHVKEMSRWRFLQPLGSGFAVDAIPEVGGTVGNVMTYGEIGTLFRIGRNLEAEFEINGLALLVSTSCAMAIGLH